MTDAGPVPPADVRLARVLVTQLSGGSWAPGTAALTGAYRVATATGEIRLTRALAAHPDLPGACLAALAGHPLALVRRAVAMNPGTPPEAKLTLIANETDPDVYATLATSCTDPVVLCSLAARAAREPRASVQPKITWRNDRERHDPRCAWESTAANLWGNPALPEQDGYRLAVALLGHLAKDAADDPQDHSGRQSILWQGLRDWIRAHPDRGLQLARQSQVPYLLVCAVDLPGADTRDVDRVLTHLIAAVLGAGATPGGVPETIRGVLHGLHAAGQFTDSQLEQVRTLLTDGGWDIADDGWLSPIVHPCDDDAGADEPVPHLSLFAAGSLEDVCKFVLHAKHTGPRAALAAFLARRDVDTLTACTIAGAHLNLGLDREWVCAQRPWDRDLAVQLLSRVPGCWPDVDDLDLLCDAVTYRLAERESPPAEVDEDVLDKLGDRVLRMPWPLLARIDSPYVAQLLEPVLADPYALALFSNMSPTYAGTLPDLICAVRAALAPADGDAS